MVSFVKNYFLEYVHPDDDTKPFLGFAVQNTLMGIALAAVVYLCAQLVSAFAFRDPASVAAQAFHWCALIAAAVTLMSFLTAVFYLKVLFWRDDHDLETSGTALSLTATTVAAVLFSVASTSALLALAGA